MAQYSLNEVLKARAAQANLKKVDEEVKLDDVTRVKVLSPGRKVFKRFIRNRLAVVGSIILITMFVFCFAGPLLYPYGQKDVFHAFKKVMTNYAQATQNTNFTGFVLDENVKFVKNTKLSVNTNIKNGMKDADVFLSVATDDKSDTYCLERLNESAYRLSLAEAEEVCSTGGADVKIGVFDPIIGFSAEEDYTEDTGALSAALKEKLGGGKAAKGKKGDSGAAATATEGTVTVDGVVYSFKKQDVGKKYDITMKVDGVVFASAFKKANPGFDFDGFAALLEEGNASALTFNDAPYSVITDKKGVSTVFSIKSTTPGMIYTTYSFSGTSGDNKIPDAFRAKAISAAFGDGVFTDNGTEYHVANEEGTLVVTLADGTEYGELSTWRIVNSRTGNDNFSYEFKSSVLEAIGAMQEHNAKYSAEGIEIPAEEETEAETEASGGAFSADDTGEEEQQGLDTDAYITELPWKAPLDQKSLEDGKLMYNEDGSVVVADDDITIIQTSRPKVDETQQEQLIYTVKANQVDWVMDTYAAPTWSHILGTDGDGMDVFSRVMHGGRVSLLVGFVVVILETILGVIMGGLAGYFGGWVDTVIMRLVDIFYCLPSMPIMIILGAMMDAMRMDVYTRLFIMMAALGIMGWAGVARLVRGQILSLREQEFMVAAEATGIKVRARIFRHLVPNVMPQLIVTATMGLGGVILTESTLSFLGLGVKHPLATWGTMINSVSSATAMKHYAFIWIPIGLLICLTVIAFNFVGDGLRDAYDPRSKR